MKQDNNFNDVNSFFTIDWICNHTGFVTFVVTALSFFIAIVFYALQCGSAVFFNIPINEVPFSRSIESFIIYFVLTLILIIPNYIFFIKITNISTKPCKVIFTVIFTAICFFLLYAFCLLFSIALNPASFFSDPGSNCELVFWLNFSILFFGAIFCFLGGLVTSLLMTQAPKKNKQTKPTKQVLSTDKMIHNFFRKKIQKLCGGNEQKQQHNLHSKYKKSLMLLFGVSLFLAGTFMWGILNAAHGISARSIATYNNGTYLVAFSDANNYCVKPCIPPETQEGSIKVLCNHYKWIPKNSTDVRILNNIQSIELLND